MRRRETPAAAFETNATIIPIPTPDARAEINSEFNAISSTRMLASLRIADNDALLVSMRLIDTTRGCETLSAWTGWRPPPAHQASSAASIAVGRLFEPRASAVVVVSGKPTPGTTRSPRERRFDDVA